MRPGVPMRLLSQPASTQLCLQQPLRSWPLLPVLWLPAPSPRLLQQALPPPLVPQRSSPVPQLSAAPDGRALGPSPRPRARRLTSPSAHKWLDGQKNRSVRATGKWRPHPQPSMAGAKRHGRAPETTKGTAELPPNVWLANERRQTGRHHLHPAPDECEVPRGRRAKGARAWRPPCKTERSGAAPTRATLRGKPRWFRFWLRPCHREQ